MAMTQTYRNLPDELPSLTALRAFEAAAKHLSFTQAAKELSVTIGAVSRQIKQLEKQLNTPLFDRSQRGVRLTQAGAMFYDTVAHNFDQIRLAAGRLKQQQVHSLSLACTTAMASLWLTPRLGDFWQQYPEIIVNHALTNNLNSLNRQQADLYIRYGSGQWHGQVASHLYTDKLYPVCSPDFYQANADKPLQDLTLLQMSDDGADKNAWHDWLQTQQLNATEFNWRHLSNYLVVVHAAMHGQGVAMAWHSLVKDWVEQGRLVRFAPQSIDTSGAFYLTWSADTALSPEAECFRQWLLDEANSMVSH